MRIVFFYASEIIKEAGGVENVTEFWYRYFSKYGNIVHLIFFKKHQKLKAILPQVQLPETEQCYSPSNVKFIEEYLVKHHIDIVINQSAVNSKTSLVCIEACHKTKTHLISVIHNTPDLFLRSKKYFRLFLSYHISKWGLYHLWYFIQCCLPCYKGGKYIYNNSDAVVVLSPCYIKEYCQLNVGYLTEKVGSIVNPLTFNLPDQIDNKENFVLFVGRLDPQKALDKLLHIWQKIETMPKVNDWHLMILGDGLERKNLQRLSQRLNLRRIQFIGQANPASYYHKAKIMCMTSIYEGLPMTLIECQAYGVVPVLYNSFSAATDVVTNGYNGFLIPPYEQTIYIKRLSQLMTDTNMLKQMQIECRKRIKSYDAKRIANEWFNLIMNIMNNKSE
jgi:glycosyltransferase involved in cell wall biosynthesis